MHIAPAATERSIGVGRGGARLDECGGVHAATGRAAGAEMKPIPRGYRRDHYHNIVELYAYLTGGDCPEPDALDLMERLDFLQKPWKWTDERERMLAEMNRAERERPT